MRFSLCYLQLRAFVSADANMYYYSRSRPRDPWRRDFSNAPKDDQFVSGDSHVSSVGQANYAHRQFQPPNFPNPGLSQPQPPPYRQWLPHFRHPRPVRPPNYKPPDYRNWEYALSQPPSHCERFIVLSYNILADYLAINHRRELYFHIPWHILDWEWRRKKILFELGLWSPDIMCLQEVDRFQDLEEELKLHGYSGIWKMRTGIPVDGCAIFWRTTRFKLLYEESIEYNRLQLRDNVAQICVLESRNQNCAGDRSDASPPRNEAFHICSSNGVNRVVVCNTHVLYNPRRGEIKLGQVRVLLDRAHAVSKLWDDAPVIICGDFNCTPKSPLYNFISEQKLDLTGLARDQVSGQSSAEIRTHRTYTPNSGYRPFRAQDVDNSNQASMIVEKKGFAVEQTDCIPDIHKHDKSIFNGESPALTNNLRESQTAARVDYASNIPSSDVKNEEESSLFRAEDVDNSNQASILGEKKGFVVEQTECIPNIHNHDKLVINGENPTFTNNLNVSQSATSVDYASNILSSDMKNKGESPAFTNNLHQSQSAARVNYASNTPSSDVKNEEESSAISDESSKETQHEVIDISEKKLSSSCCVSVDLVANDSRDGDLQDQTPPLISCENRNSVEVKYEDGNQSGVSTDHSFPAALTTDSQSNSDMINLVGSTLKEGLVHDDTDEGNPQIKENNASTDSCVYFAELKHDGKLENAVVQDTSDSVPDTPFSDDNKVCISESLGNFSLRFTSEEKASTSDQTVNEVDSSDVSASDFNKNRGKVSIYEQSSNGVDSSDVSSCDFSKDQELLHLKLGEVTMEDGKLNQSCTSTSSSEVSRTEGIIQSDDDDNNAVAPESGETDQYLEKNSIAPPNLQLPPGYDGVQGESSLYNDSGLTAREKYTYDPSSWTPMEIEIASGNAECTLIEHPLKLKSTYAEVEDYSGTRDLSREPQITSYNRKFMGTVDYIWCSEGLQTVKVLDTIPKHALQWTPGFPTPKWGSDHFALASQLAFTKGIDRS